MYESVVLAGLILQVVTFLTLSFFLFQLSTQQGRILLRLDNLQGKRAQPDDGTVASGPKGLAVGTAIADIELPDLTGRTRSLSEFRGRRLLLLKDSAAEKYLSEQVFKYCGTPSAYLLDGQGQVAQRLAAGMTAVVALAREAAEGEQPKNAALRKLPLSESRIEREGLRAGTPAPDFDLPDIEGQ